MATIEMKRIVGVIRIIIRYNKSRIYSV